MNFRRLLIFASAAAGSLGLASLSSKHRPGDEIPYVGQYSLDIGGGDAMSGVHLLLFVGGDYAITYFGGIQQGTWQALPNGELELKEWPADPADFVLYGSHNPALGSEVRLRFKNFEESLAKIGLDAAGQGLLPMHPAFSAQANGYDDSYSVKRPAADLPILYLAAYQDESIKPEYRVPVTKEVLYSFPISKQYNDYLVIYNKNASLLPTRYMGHVVDKKLTLYQMQGERPAAVRPFSYGESRPISATDLKELKPYIKSARATLPDELDVSIEKGAKTTRYYRVVGTTELLKHPHIKLLEPLFKTSYD